MLRDPISICKQSALCWTAVGGPVSTHIQRAEKSTFFKKTKSDRRYSYFMAILTQRNDYDWWF
jgi:hypothetical protein